MKILKILHEWPLSKVELVEIKGEKYILKSIHKDFINEVYMQKFLEKKCEKIRIPKVHWMKKEDKNIVFLMDYIKGRAKVSINDSLRLISKFHKETSNMKSRYFRNYDFNEFYKDFLKVKKHLPKKLKDRSKSELRIFLKGVFASQKSVVHGDFGKDQIIGGKNRYIIDLGKSFYGPSILDYGHLFLKDRRINRKSLTYIGTRETLIKSKIVVGVITLSWLELCKKKYISYDYKKELKEYEDLLKYNLEALK